MGLELHPQILSAVAVPAHGRHECIWIQDATARGNLQTRAANTKSTRIQGAFYKQSHTIPRVWALSESKHSIPILSSLLLYLAANDLSKQEVIMCKTLMVTNMY